MPASIPTLALTTPADAKGFWEAYPSAPEGPERAVWEDRLIEALTLEWFRTRQDLLEERGACIRHRVLPAQPAFRHA